MNPEKLSNPLFTLTIGEFIKLIEEVNRDLVNQKPKEISVNQKVENEIMTINEVTDFLKISKSLIYKMNCYRRIPHLKRGGRVYYKRSELMAWLNEGHVKTQEEIERDVTNKFMKIRRKGI